VLDFACGNGISSYALARSGYAVTGIDSSRGQIAGIPACEKIIGLDGAVFQAQYSSGEKLVFDEGSFDIVWVREALHHIKNLNEFLMEVSRILKPDGLLCCLREVVIWNESQREHFFATHPLQPIVRDEGCYYLKEYLSAFEQANFKLVRMLEPNCSIINTYPEPAPANAVFNRADAEKRREGYDIFSFFLMRCAVPVTRC
jgi:SAM-dependent methyltransferase